MWPLSFLRPEALWGLLALALPLIIHLIGNKRRKTVKIATLRFLEKARVKAQAKLRLKELLLLLMRMLILALLALLFGGPVLRGFSGGSNDKTAIVLDNSLSMSAAYEAGTALESARKSALAMLDSSSESDRFWIVLTGEEGDQLPTLVDRNAARERVEKLEGATIDRGILLALKRADSAISLEGGGKILLLTDMQANAWRDLSSLGGIKTPVKMVDAGGDARGNSWVEKIEQVRDTFTVFVKSSGGHKPGPVTLALPGGGALTTQATGASLVFKADALKEAGIAKAMLKDGGTLSLDDELSFVAKNSGPVKVLLVNGSPNGFRLLDELLFISRALTSGGRIGEQISVRESKESDLTPEKIAGADVIWLANPAGISMTNAKAIMDRVQNGAGLIVSAGENYTPERRDPAIDMLLASPMRDRLLIQPKANPPFLGVDKKSMTGSLAPLAESGVGLDDVKVRGYWLCDTGTSPDVSVLLKLENGAPLLLEKRHGKGRMMTFLTTVDRDWTDFCLSPAYLPLLEQVIKVSAGRESGELPAYAQLERPPVSPYAETVELENPKRERLDWLPGEPARTPLPGPYMVYRNGVAVDGFVARIDPLESDLTRIPEDELTQKANAVGLKLERGEKFTGSGQSDAYPYLAAIMIFALIVEGFLSTRWPVKKPKLTDLFEDRP